MGKYSDAIPYERHTNTRQWENERDKIPGVLDLKVTLDQVSQTSFTSVSTTLVQSRPWRMNGDPGSSRLIVRGHGRQR